MIQERSAELVSRRQGVGHLVHEGGGPQPGRLRVGAPALRVVHAGGGGGDAPFDERQLLLGNQLSAFLNQPAEDREWLRSEGATSSRYHTQLLAGEVEGEITER